MPRGVAIGLLVGIFLMVPGLQIIGAALLSVPFRGNIPIAAAMTFLSNPATTPFILAASYFVGAWFGRARGLIALAVLAAIGLGVSSGAERFGGQVGSNVYRPADAAGIAMVLTSMRHFRH